MRRGLIGGVAMGVLLCLSGAMADTVTDVGIIGGTWVWVLNTAQAAGTVIEFTNPAGLPWTLPGAWTTSAPTTGGNWIFDTSSGNGGGTLVLRWTAGSGGGGMGVFSATPVGAHDVGGNYSIEQNGSSPPEWKGSIHVPVVPEASTVALLALGLFAGALLKRRKELS